MYSRHEIKALTDKVLNMTKADAVEVSFDGGERSATRWANSSITVNMVQYDQQLTLNLRHGAKQGSASTREFDDESLKAMVDEAQDAAQKARDNPNLPPLVKGPQDYIPVDAVLPKTAEQLLLCVLRGFRGFFLSCPRRPGVASRLNTPL